MKSEQAVKLFGIKNCDTVKKARRWLDGHQLEYQFHDLRADGLAPATIHRWLTRVSAADLVNRRSTTWKALDPDTRNNLDDRQVPELLLAHPTLIKRPVLEADGRLLVGFSAPTYQAFFDL